MKKINYGLIIGMLTFISCQKEQSLPASTATAISQSENVVATSFVTIPVTAVSFPKEVISADGGRIDFWAKLEGYNGGITTGGYDPHFFQIYDGTSTFHMGFNANDGVANGGLIGDAGNVNFCGTGFFGSWSFESVYGAGNVNKWHHYVFIWDKNGLTCLNDKRKKVAIYVDGKLNTNSWHAGPVQEFLPLTGGTLNLITTGGPLPISDGEVVIDEFKIYNRNGKLILWNTLGSADEVTHSAVGLNGSFNGGGDAHFVPGKSGYAVMAKLVMGVNY